MPVRELPSQTEQLQHELDEYFNSGEAHDCISLGKLKHLDAVINESMRLHPPVPSGVNRVTGPEGLTVGGTYIPGNTIVQAPMHTIFRDPRCFERPLEFIPERWTTRPELTKHAAAFAPFIIGSHSCVGKALALTELRYVVAHVLRRYNFSFAPEQEVEAFLDGKRDTFTLFSGPLHLVFTPRSRAV